MNNSQSLSASSDRPVPVSDELITHWLFIANINKSMGVNGSLNKAASLKQQRHICVTQQSCGQTASSPPLCCLVTLYSRGIGFYQYVLQDGAGHYSTF